MMFSELYSAYYNTVAQVIKVAIDHPLQKNELYAMIEKNAFGESILNIGPAISEGRWQLINPDGTTALKHAPTLPMTTLQKRWLKAIFADPRVKLFTDDEIDFPGVEPLFRNDDILVFDKYSDGDPYTDESYIKNFRLVLDAIYNRYPLNIDTTNRKGGITHMVMMPEYLEYSEKDDKFRLIGSGCRYGKVVNLARIVNIKPYNKPFKIAPEKQPNVDKEIVEFELADYRNALERVLMHFANFEKQAVKLDDKHYNVTVKYDRDDETEMVIRILSFGPMVRVTAPRHFIDLIKERLLKQKGCEH